MALLRLAINRKAATRIVVPYAQPPSNSLGEEEFEYKLKPLLKRRRWHLNALQATGAEVVLVSQGLDHVNAPAGAALGVQWIIANRLDFRDGVATGRLLSPVIRPRGIFARIREAGPDGQQSPARAGCGRSAARAQGARVVPAVRVEEPRVQQRWFPTRRGPGSAFRCVRLWAEAGAAHRRHRIHRQSLARESLL